MAAKQMEEIQKKLGEA
ncbi:BnaA10g17110D [Brassica napus]|uniref:BnaA10g17110D protein n=1 Tax=Brassica napus TaxID=3708 RepID=A0A078HKP0_BRANA|nr:BnaA10g17110D [Brassica napus]